MDRRQLKTRQAIFDALVHLLEEDDYQHISVRRIIDEANVGRTTFYAHFETKDELLHELCRSLFDHVFKAEHTTGHAHADEDDAGGDMILHILHHIQEDDRGIKTLLMYDTSGIAKRFFCEDMKRLITRRTNAEDRNPQEREYLITFLVQSFSSTVQWWLKDARALGPEQVARMYYSAAASALSALQYQTPTIQR